jgi:D-alanyl-D-alanine dipeptidase
MDYATKNNFTGSVIPGYNEPIAYLTERAIFALYNIQEILLRKNQSLFIFDAYRPKKSVDFFCNNWKNIDSNTQLKQQYYPNKTVDSIFTEGFIATESSHSRGSAVDLSIFDLSKNKLLDMGGIFDFFDDSSFTAAKEIGETAIKNRMYLMELMQNNGFLNYEKEWWHFRLKNEPYPSSVFDFDID